MLNLFRTISLSLKIAKVLSSQNVRKTNAVQDRDAISQLANLINCELFINKISKKRFEISVNSIYPDIEQYRKEIKQLTGKMKHGVKIEAAQSQTPVLINLAAFFRNNEDRIYLEPEKSLEQFFDQVTLFCSEVQRCESATYGIDEHNYRMIRQTMTNILEVMIQISREF